MDFGTDMSSDALLHAAQTKAEAVFLVRSMFSKEPSVVYLQDDVTGSGR